MDMNEKMIKLADQIFELNKEYLEEYRKVNTGAETKRGTIYVKNDETGELFVYSEGDFTDVIINRIEEL